MLQHPVVWLTFFNKTEVAHAIHLYAFRGVCSVAEAQRVWHLFQRDCRQDLWTPVDLPSKTWEVSIDLALRFSPALGVRTLDSLHVACALELKAQRFWTFDDRQARLAEAVGLDTKS